MVHAVFDQGRGFESGGGGGGVGGGGGGREFAIPLMAFF